jgi:hypothetical protein
MIKIHTSPEQFRIGYITSMLEQAGIKFVVRNQFLSGALGELPPNECWPEIWITDDEYLDAAMEIVTQASAEVINTGPWQCLCGEENEGQFGSCWKCGSDKTVRSEV